jgi:hypothetical protein
VGSKGGVDAALASTVGGFSTGEGSAPDLAPPSAQPNPIIATTMLSDGRDLKAKERGVSTPEV